MFISQIELCNKLGISLQLMNYHVKKGNVKTKQLHGMTLVDGNTKLKRNKKHK